VTAAALRILHAPLDVGGNAFGLSRAERELGLQSDVAVLVSGPFGYGADISLELADKPVWSRLGARLSLLRRALRDYDVIHFNFGQSFVAFQLAGHVVNELPLIRRAGKKVLVTFQGCDVRPQACCFCQRDDCRADDRYRGPRARRFLQYADRSFHLNPDLGRWLPGSTFIPYANVDPRELLPALAPTGRDELVVAHAPTSREVKGTRHVLAAVAQLQSEGIALRLELLEGVSRAEVLGRLKDADVVVDQLLLGWYGGFAVEAMALQKPVICHIGETHPNDNPFGDELPIVRATPQTLADVLRDLARDPGKRMLAGRTARAFVERHHDPRKIARQALSGLAELPPPVRR
jgi:glycosyltransferase involved in cell wall biosynthesis